MPLRPLLAALPESHLPQPQVSPLQAFRLCTRVGSTHSDTGGGGGVLPILRLCPTPTSTYGIRVPRGSPRVLVGSGRTSEAPPLIPRAQHPPVPWRTQRAEPVPDHPHPTPPPGGATQDRTRPPPAKALSGTVASKGGDSTLGDGPRPTGPSKAEGGRDLDGDAVGRERGSPWEAPASSVPAPPPCRLPPATPACPQQLARPARPRRPPQIHRGPRSPQRRSQEPQRKGERGADRRGRGRGPART